MYVNSFIYFYENNAKTCRYFHVCINFKKWQTYQELSASNIIGVISVFNNLGYIHTPFSQ